VASRPPGARIRPRLGIESGAVLDVHRHVLQKHRIEDRVLEWEMQGVADLEGNAIGQPTARRQVSGRIDESGAQVDACHLAAEGGSEIARRAADAAAEVQYARR